MFGTARLRLQARPTLGFNARLLLAVAVALALIGFVGYALLNQRLEHRLVNSYAHNLKADAKSLDAVGPRSRDKAEAIQESQEIVSAIGNRPGTVEVLLIDEFGVVRAAADPDMVGTRDVHAGITAALREGTSYAGPAQSADADTRNFEFIEPVELFGSPLVLEMAIAHRELQAHMGEVREVLVLIGLITLFGGGLTFYLVGGRAR